MKKRLTVPLLCLMLLLSGCTAGNAPDVRAGTPSPLSLSSPGAGGEVTARLYFRYGDTACLAGEERTLTLDRSQTAERVILQALLDGPQAQSASLTPLFPEGTRLLSVASADGTLFVTFSEELLGRYADEAGDGNSTEKTLRRRLCMACATGCRCWSSGRARRSRPCGCPPVFTGTPRMKRPAAPFSGMKAS